MRWVPSMLWMIVIFLASGTPSRALPQFGAWDYLVKKGGHMLGYLVLGLLYLRGLDGRERRFAEAWTLAVMYALADEFHQSFVPGRHPSLVDALVFDGGGAAAGLFGTWMVSRNASLRTPNSRHRE
jgi:VanZ family protein